MVLIVVSAYQAVRMSPLRWLCHFWHRGCICFEITNSNTWISLSLTPPQPTGTEQWTLTWRSKLRCSSLPRHVWRKVQGRKDWELRRQKLVQPTQHRHSQLDFLGSSEDPVHILDRWWPFGHSLENISSLLSCAPSESNLDPKKFRIKFRFLGKAWCVNLLHSQWWHAVLGLNKSDNFLQRVMFITLRVPFPFDG